MYFHPKLFVGESVRGKEKKICRKLKHGAGMTRIHVIVLNQGKDLFDIYHCAFFKQRVLRKLPLCVVGLAGSRDEAVDMVTEILGHIYRETGNTDVKRYFLQPQDEAETMR